jgi:hypothetical protein
MGPARLRPGLSVEISRVFCRLHHAKKSQEIPIRLRRTSDGKFGKLGTFSVAPNG